jgi:hypothetical protein
LDLNDPISLISIPGGFLATNFPGTLIWLDPRFQPVRAADFLKAKPGVRIHRKLEAFGLEDPRLVGNFLLGFTTLHLDGKGWQGFIRASLNPLVVTDLIEEIDHEAPEERLFRLLGMDTALTEGSGYILRWGQPTSLLQIWPQKRRLKAFPPDFETLPKLPQGVGGMAAGGVLYKALEHSKSAVSLYGQGAYLYLLTRKPTEQRTLWQLWQIDPKRDTIVRSMTLPTQANHVFLVPGPINWAVIEKGPVIQTGDQAIKSMVLLPASWIEDPASKALSDGSVVACD